MVTQLIPQFCVLKAEIKQENKQTIPDIRSRFNVFSPTTERFTFPLWTVSILRICLKIIIIKKRVIDKEILTYFFHQLLKKRTNKNSYRNQQQFLKTFNFQLNVYTSINSTGDKFYPEQNYSTESRAMGYNRLQMVWQCSVCCKGEVTVDDEGFSGREKAISQLKNLNSILENCTLSKVLSYSTDVMLDKSLPSVSLTGNCTLSPFWVRQLEIRGY